MTRKATTTRYFDKEIEEGKHPRRIEEKLEQISAKSFEDLRNFSLIRKN